MLEWINGKALLKYDQWLWTNKHRRELTIFSSFQLKSFFNRFICFNWQVTNIHCLFVEFEKQNRSFHWFWKCLFESVNDQRCSDITNQFSPIMSNWKQKQISSLMSKTVKYTVEQFAIVNRDQLQMSYHIECLIILFIYEEKKLLISFWQIFS